jgi:hypothetical protein
VFVAKKKNILLIIERNNYKSDISLMTRLVTIMQGLGYDTLWYRHNRVSLNSKLDKDGKYNNYPLHLRRTIKAFLLLMRPALWTHFLNARRSEVSILKKKQRKLKTHISALAKKGDITVLSRSAGARMASLIADEAGVKKLICIGYPFKHPNGPEDPDRYEHLAVIKTPTLIIQGTLDEYGGTEVPVRYNLSSSIKLKFVETTHDFNLKNDQWEVVTEDIKEFIKS